MAGRLSASGPAHAIALVLCWCYKLRYYTSETTALRNLQFSTLDEFDEESEILEKEIADVRGQLEKATAHMLLTGEYADPDWFRRAKAALRYKGQEHQVLLKERAALRKRLSQEKSATLDRLFIESARAMLDESTFYAISRDAQAKFEGLNNAN